MKVLAVLLFLFPLHLYSQDCELKDEKDRYNQETRLTTGFKSLGAGSNKFLLSISADKKEIDFFFALDKAGTCFNNNSRAMVMLDGKQRVSVRNGGTINCKGYFHLIFPNQERLNANLVKLSEKKIMSVEFTDASNEKEILTIYEDDQEKIMQMVACIMEQLEALRIDTWKPKQ